MNPLWSTFENFCLANHVLVERLHEAPIRHRHTHFRRLLLDHLRGAHRMLKACANCQERNLDLGLRIRTPDDAPLAYFDGGHVAGRGHLLERVTKKLVEPLGPEAVAAGVADA